MEQDLVLVVEKDSIEGIIFEELAEVRNMILSLKEEIEQLKAQRKEDLRQVKNGFRVMYDELDYFIDEVSSVYDHIEHLNEKVALRGDR